MTIEYAILGLLSLRPMTGYDIKKVFAGTAALYWSDNNNQIYRTLLNLHRDQLLEREIQPQENYPARKVYRISEKGREELRAWAGSRPELPQLKQAFLIQLAWADLLSQEELEHLLDTYEEEVQTQWFLCQAERQPATSGAARETYLQVSRARTEREKYLWEMIQENWIDYFAHELEWVRKVRSGLKVL
ncbi:MAG TPA: PadR family transcriptional regulator [Anaerolinea sp.]|nr:PadR family transcriptional regulator [Anaerolinea sp.]